MQIRPANEGDKAAIWQILMPVIRAAETLALPKDMNQADALSAWFRDENRVFVAVDDVHILGTYYMRPNQSGGGGHVCNAAYVTASSATGKGIARQMCEHSIAAAKADGYRAMQFNFVVSSNERAVALWQSCGFETIAHLPAAFAHPSLGYVDALIMHRTL